MKYLLNLLLLTTTMVLFTACSSKPTHLELVIQSSKDLNPDINEVSSPLMITFYELESAEEFLKFDYWTILAKSGKNLDKNLISQAKHIITPEQEQTYKILFTKRAKFLGVLGQFRNIKNNTKWKHVINLEDETYNYNELRIDKYNIERIK